MSKLLCSFLGCVAFASLALAQAPQPGATVSGGGTITVNGTLASITITDFILAP